MCHKIVVLDLVWTTNCTDHDNLTAIRNGGRHLEMGENMGDVQQSVSQKFDQLHNKICTLY